MYRDEKELTRRSFLGKNIHADVCLAATGTLGSTDAWSADQPRKGIRKKKTGSRP